MNLSLVKFLQLLLALSVLIAVHEGGHFFFAKLFKIRVDKFFLFFDIGGRKLLSTKTGWFSRLFPSLKDKQTEYGIGWLPLGGYCKIYGMIDESFDTSYVDMPPSPEEFRSKRPWQRLLVMAGGVLFNLIFAVLLGIVSLKVWGDKYVPNSESAIYASPLAEEMGFRTGDRILSLDDYVPRDFLSLPADIARRNVHKAVVLRDGDTVSVYIDRSYIGRLLQTESFFDLALPFMIDTIPPFSPNYGAGFLKGDRIIGVDTVETEFFQDTRAFFLEHPSARMTARVIRGADTISVPVRTDSSGRAHIYASLDVVKQEQYSLLESVPAGFSKTISIIKDYLRDLRMLATPSTGAYKSMGSFITMAGAMPVSWDWERFLRITTLLSVILAIMNLLPIPALDGGHIAFVLFEMVTGRKPSDRFLMVAQIVGLILLMLLMLLACGNDISRLIR